MEITKKIAAGFFKICSWIILLLTVVSFVFVLIFPLFGLKPYIVQSGSMEPVIHTGSVVYINELAKNDIEVGDIIAYRLTNRIFVTHRVVEMSNDSVITKGDANESPDLAPISKKNIIGKFMFTIPWIGYPITRIKENPLIAIPLICGLLIIIIVDNLFDRNRLNQSKKKIKFKEADSSNSV